MNPRPLRYRGAVFYQLSYQSQTTAVVSGLWLHSHLSFFHYLIATVGHLLPQKYICNGIHMFFFTLDLGYFMSMGARKGISDDNAGLYLKFKGDTCLTFWYNMRGKGAGSLEVTVDKRSQLVLELKGPKDTDWHKAQVQVTGAKRKVRLIRSRPHYTQEKFLNGAFTLRKHEMFSVRTPQYTPKIN